MVPITPKPSVAIIGGGIGGLVLALQLEASGFRQISIFESSRVLSPTIGTGINIQPSAVLVLRNLGLLPALEAVAIKTAELRFYNTRGQFVFGEPRGEEAGYTVPQLSVHRGMLHQVLLVAVKERLGAGSVWTDHVFTSFSQDNNGITARFNRKSDPRALAEMPSITTDLLVGADGINSAVRSLLYPDEGPPNFSGLMLYRGVTLSEPFLGGRSMLWAGHNNQKFIAYPVGREAELQGKSLVNWIAEFRVRAKDDPDDSPPQDWGRTVSKDVFAHRFADWKFDFLSIQKLMEETKQVYEFPMCDRNPVEKWSFGRLTLLGDAAHPLYPIGSNGASQAILDAVSLTAALLREVSNIPAALTSYQNERLPPTAKICIANRGQGPDHVLQLAHERAPDGFENINDVITMTELEEVGRKYKLLAGFDMETVNRKAKETEGIWKSSKSKGNEVFKTQVTVGLEPERV